MRQLGRKTYEIFAGSWPNATDPADAVAAARRLKSEDGGEIQVHGSGGLLQTLLRHDRVRTPRLWHFPVVLGGGRPCSTAVRCPRGCVSSISSARRPALSSTSTTAPVDSGTVKWRSARSRSFSDRGAYFAQSL